MVRIGGFLKSQNRIRRQRARGRFISPYQVGETIFGQSTVARCPLMHTSSQLKHLKSRRRRRMKEGTIFGKLTRMHNNPLGFPSAYPVDPVQWARTMARSHMKGGNLFRRLKKRIQIDFPHRPFASAFPIADLHKTRRAIKRGRQ